MARSSQTFVAVLGALSTGPMTGYEVRAAIADVLGHFWHESFGQIYPTLHQLEADGYIRRSIPGRTSGSTFEITDSGLELLRASLSEPAQPRPPRDPRLLRLFFAEQLGPAAARALLAQMRQSAQSALSEYALIRAEIDLAQPGEVYRAMTLSYGEQMARAQLEWADACLAELSSESI